jgi:hypothetical protein
MILLFCKCTSRSYNIATKASTTKKQSGVLHDEVEVGEYLLLSESGGSLSYSEFDADSELDDPALLDAVVNDSSDEDDNNYSRLCLGKHSKL